MNILRCTLAQSSIELCTSPEVDSELFSAAQASCYSATQVITELVASWCGSVPRPAALGGSGSDGKITCRGATAACTTSAFWRHSGKCCCN